MQPASTAGSTSSAAQATTSPAPGGRGANAGANAAANPQAGRGGFQRAEVNSSSAAPQQTPAQTASASNTASAANLPSLANTFSPAGAGTNVNPDLLGDGLLVNGSVNNGAASPFAQLAAFGNNRRGGRSLYNWSVFSLFDTSKWDAAPFSFASQSTAKPSYTDSQIVATFGGPLKLPGVPPQKRPTVFLTYQRTTNNSATTQSSIVPTALERSGDFSQSVDAFGRPLQLIDPTTGQPFAGNLIPPGNIASQASALLGYYPLPNLVGGRFNYQIPVLATTKQDGVQARVTETFSGKNSMFGTLAYARTITDTTNLFNFTDANRVSNFDTNVNWQHRFSPFLSLRTTYRFTRIATDTSPFFSNRENVSGLAGIAGNNQSPENWGPPNLSFASGVAGLSTGQFASNHDLTHAFTAETLWSHGRHSFTFGGDLRLRHLDIVSQQNARGSFHFAGTTTGSDLADFLLGLPSTSAIAFGNADKYLRANTYDAYINDDWRVSPGLTANLGLRWEYEAPMTELQGRLVNLDIAPGFTAASPVVASSPVGSITGRRYDDSLIKPDRLGFQPRVAIAWRPIAGSSVVVRAGYGIYRNTSVYQSIAMLLTQQPPLSTAFSVSTSAANPLTLANGFVTGASAAANTFGVDPNFHVGFAQNWQVSIQRDLPASLTMVATYLGTKGNNLMQEVLPNTYPIGAVNPCLSCPSGFVYLTSNGSSTREAGQIQIRRRLRSGFTATVQYTLAKATDNATAFGGASLAGSAIAQNWLDLDAERGPSNFDQRHQITAQAQYTTGMGVAGGALLTGWKGALFKGWTVTSQLTAGSGLPVTPVYLAAVPGTGFSGSIRANLIADPTSGAAFGYYLNPAAFTVPAAGQWGTAGRNSVRGPSQFSLNAGLGRTFLLGERLSLDWRLDATNVLNRVTYSTINTLVGSSQFGLPTQANTMRKIQSSARLRF
jgi:hypothetical protein